MNEGDPVPEATNHADTYHRHGDLDPSQWDEATAVTDREPDDVQDNTTFASRKQIQSAENKAVQSSESKTLADMTKAELIAEAGRRNVDVAKSATKAEIIDALS